MTYGTPTNVGIIGGVKFVFSLSMALVVGTYFADKVSTEVFIQIFCLSIFISYIIISIILYLIDSYYVNKKKIGW